MPDWPHIKDIGGHKTLQTFAEADFLAFLTYAGPPPIEKEGELYRTTMLRQRIKYIQLADNFCCSYFGDPETCQEYADYIGFYGKFIEWHACKIAIAVPDPTLFVESDVCVYKWRKAHERKK